MLAAGSRGAPATGVDAGARVTVTFGTYRVAASYPAGLATGRHRPWMDPPGLPADVEAQVTCGAVAGVAALTFSRLDPSGCAFDAEHCSVAVDFAVGTGTLRLIDTDDPRQRARAGLEALLSTGYAHVLLRGGIWLHAASLILDGRAYVVAGPSTAGKTTLAMRFPDAWLHDEHTFAVPTPDGWQVWRQAEWRGTREPRPWTVPLGGVLVLGADRSRTAVTPLPAGEGLSRMLATAYYAGGVAATRLLANGCALAAAYPVMELSHCLDDSPDVVAQCIVAAGRG